MIPPAGTRVALTALSSALISSRSNISAQLTASLSRYLGIPHFFFMASGRACLTLTLEILAQRASRDEVIIPAYTCFSVPSAIVRSGLKIKLCDVSLETLDFDIASLEKLIDHRTLCVIPSNLFGLPSDMVKIRELAGLSGAFVIDDAAQSLGSSLHGRKSGTSGEIGVFSLGRGKNITTYEGGVIATACNDLAEQFQQYAVLTTQMRAFPTLKTCVGLLCQAIFFHPHFYWILDRCPFLQLGSSKFDPNFPMERFSRYQSALALLMLNELDAINEQRRRNALYLEEKLRHNALLLLPEPVKESSPVYLRFPMLVLKPDLREKIYTELRRSGLGVSKMYPTAIHRISGLLPHLLQGQQTYPRADLLATSILTLPTHPTVTRRDLDRMIKVINKCTQSKAS
jgi:dTDP-4-amino-4,6-dideoxygalactose transaminase